MRVLLLRHGDAPRAWGRAHGESFRGEIQSLAAIRIYLTVELAGHGSAARVLDLAQAHLPVLERFDPALHEELLGIAEGANLSPAHIVVLNHYTDLRDIDPRGPHADPRGAHAADAGAPAAGQGRDAAGGCSTIWARTPAGPVLAQTWDMHATAIPYMLMLRVPAQDGRPAMWLLSLTGCLGMAGMSHTGLGVAINNLRSTDARVGVVWPALVRRALAEPDARAAAALILHSPVGSGHHYLAADADRALGVETSGERRKQVFEAGAGDAAYIHTNHCLDAEIGAVSRELGASTSRERYAWLEHSLAARPIADVHDAWARLGSTEGYPRSVCTNMATPENPHGAATCGAIAMELGARRVWAQTGLIHNVAPEPFDFAEEPSS